MIDLRYHVYSLAAVIVALAIGFVFGTSSVARRGDVKQVNRIASHYESVVTALQDEKDQQYQRLQTTKSDLARSEKLCAALMPFVLSNKLAYRNVAIIQTGDYDNLAVDLKTVVQSAGAKVTSVTRIPVDFDFNNQHDVSDALSGAGIIPKPNETEKEAVLRTIAESLVGDRHKQRLSILQDKGVVSISGDYTKYNKLIVIVGGTTSSDDGRANLVDLPLIEKLSEIGATVVACEPANSATSYVPAWKRLDIATVDNADTSCGNVSLVYALAGEAAHYGQKRSADQLLPDTLGGGK
jgi:hypothetical protein